MGSSSSTTETMCVIYDLSYLEMTLDVDELDILDIAVGQKAEITADAISDRTFEGVVTSISSAGTTSGGTTTYPVTIRIDDTGSLMPGMNATAALDIPPCRRYVIVKATAGFAVFRLILKSLLFSFDMKKLFSLLLVCALAFTMSVSAFAAEAAPSTEKEPPAQTEVDATTRAEDIPTESAALPYYATVVNLCEGCGTYTRYYFNTTSGKLTIGGTLNSSGDENNKSRNAKIELYEVNKSGAIDSYTVSQFTESTSLSHTFRNLSANKNYYIRIVNTTGWGGPFTDLWLGGTVSISQ